MVDDFDVEVRNKHLDRTCLVDELSGGQFVLVNAAVNLGIAIYNLEQGEGIRYEALFRDEAVGALDAVNGSEVTRAGARIALKTYDGEAVFCRLLKA